MTIFKFIKKDSDWWIFTLFPVLLLFFALLFNLFSGILDFKKFSLVLSQQLIFFCIVLGATDVGIKAKNKLKNVSIGIPLILLIGCLITLMLAYTIEKDILEKFELQITFIGLSILLNFIVIRSYNKNPFSHPLGEIGPKEMTELKETHEKKKKKELLSPLKEKMYDDVAFGEKNE